MQCNACMQYMPKPFTVDATLLNALPFLLATIQVPEIHLLITSLYSGIKLQSIWGDEELSTSGLHQDKYFKRDSDWSVSKVIRWKEWISHEIRESERERGRGKKRRDWWWRGRERMRDRVSWGNKCLLWKRWVSNETATWTSEGSRL